MYCRVQEKNTRIMNRAFAALTIKLGKHSYHDTYLSEVINESTHTYIIMYSVRMTLLGRHCYNYITHPHNRQSRSQNTIALADVYVIHIRRPFFLYLRY